MKLDVQVETISTRTARLHIYVFLHPPLFQVHGST